MEFSCFGFLLSRLAGAKVQLSYPMNYSLKKRTFFVEGGKINIQEKPTLANNWNGSEKIRMLDTPIQHQEL